MNEPFPHIFGLDVVLISSEASQAFFEHVDPQGIVASDDDVYSKVVLEVVYEMRVEDVLRHQHVLLVPYFSIFRHHFYASSACLISRLHYPQFALISCLPCHFEPIIISREEICIWHKIISLRVTSPLPIQILPHIILSPQVPTPWKVIHLLELIHALKLLEMYSGDIEVDIPLISFI